MAAKIRMLTLLQEIRGFAQIASRRPSPRLPGLVLMQLRSQVTKPALPRRKLNIAIGAHGHSELPHPVRINYVNPNPASVVAPPAA
jgi:hypothetical protein